MLVIAALAAGVSALLAALVGPVLGRGRVSSAVSISVGRYLTWLLAIFLAGSVLYLALSLASGDFSIRYVWQHSAAYQSLVHRLSAILAGQEGTLLLWSFLAAMVALIAGERFERSPPQDPAGARFVRVVLLAIATLVLIVTVRSTPFQSFADAFPEAGASAVAVEGRGLNPVLQNPWMPPHTLFTFAAYALIGLAFAIGMTQLVRAAQGSFAAVSAWQAALLRSVRWSWLALTLALLTGVIWAFEEMTFGWFWSWDPVEAATLAIWLVLTACLHSGRHESAGRRGALIGPILASLSLVAVVFASFVTRSGLHPSVHAFASGATGWYLGGLLALLLISFVAASLLAWRRAARADGAGPFLPRYSLAFGLLLAAAALIVWGLSYPMLAGALFARTVELDTGFFNLWGYLLAIGLLFAIGVELKGRRRGEDRRLLGVFLALTVVAAFFKPVGGLELVAEERRVGTGILYGLWGQSSVLALLPPATYALLAVVERWWSAMRTSSRRARVRESGLAVIHAGFVMALLGVTLSTLFASSVTLAVNPFTGQLSSQSGTGVRIVDLERSETLDARGVVVEQREAATLEVYFGGALASAGQAQLLTYPERGMGRHARVLLGRGPGADVQVIYHGLAERTGDQVPVTVRRIPLVNLVWGGLTLFVLGFTLSVASRFVALEPGPSAARRVAT